MRWVISLLLGLMLMLAYLFGNLTFAGGLEGHIAHADFMNYMLGGKLIATGHSTAGQLYDIATQANVQQAMTRPYDLQFDSGLLPFVSVPLVAALASLFAALPLVVSYTLWSLVQLACLLLALWLLQSMLPTTHRFLLWLGALAYLPLYVSFTLGQVSPALLLGVTLLWWCLRKGGMADWAGGASLGLLLLKPQLLPLFLLYLLYRHNWRAIGGFAAVAGLVYLLSSVISGWNWPVPYLTFLQWAGSQSHSYGFDPAAMYNLRGLLMRFGVDSWVFVAPLTLAIILALFYIWKRSEPLVANTATRVGKLELQLATTTLAAALTSLHLYIHDLCILIFSGAVMLGWAAAHSWPSWMVATLLLGVALPALVFGQTRFDAAYILLMLGLLALNTNILRMVPREEASQ